MLKTIHSLSMLLFLILVCLAVGQLGTFFTTEDSYHWYHILNKPAFTPPNFVFPLIWTLLYVFMGFAAWLVWRLRKTGYRFALFFWGIQLILNALWTPVFFGEQELFYGLIVMGILWLFVFMTTALFLKQSKLAGFLMLIYLAWISFASILNFMIWNMNS